MYGSPSANKHPFFVHFSSETPGKRVRQERLYCARLLDPEAGLRKGAGKE